VLEEIVGAIDDEYDEPELTPVPSPEGVVLDGTLRPDDVLEACGLTLPEGDFDTLAGFVLLVLDRIPVVGDRVEWHGWELEVRSMDRRRVATVAVRPPPAEPAAAPGDDRSPS
jgi:CBS domain containing-hemolysin-like protein